MTESLISLLNAIMVTFGIVVIVLVVVDTLNMLMWKMLKSKDDDRNRN